MPERGILITFEGLDGSGKTTQMRRLAGRLRSEGRAVLETVEPGGTRIGKQVRRILLDPANHDLTPTAELLLYFACRAQNVEELILPALARGEIVLCDRFTDSTLAYQGCARELGAENVRQLDRVACQGLSPGLTLLLDIDPEASLARARRRNSEDSPEEGRFEEQDMEFFRKVRRAYQEIAAREPERVRVIDGRAAPEAVEQAIWQVVRSHV
ncbi:MAG: dTMP kinase [Bryobacteraceae bacterium]